MQAPFFGLGRQRSHLGRGSSPPPPPPLKPPSLWHPRRASFFSAHPEREACARPERPRGENESGRAALAPNGAAAIGGIEGGAGLWKVSLRALDNVTSFSLAGPRARARGEPLAVAKIFVGPDASPDAGVKTGGAATPWLDAYK